MMEKLEIGTQLVVVNAYETGMAEGHLFTVWTVTEVDPSTIETTGRWVYYDDDYYGCDHIWVELGYVEVVE